MARPALTDEQRAETRRRLRAAAAKLYTDKGLENVSARAVAEEAGVSVGTLYSYFGNLSELMQSLWRQPARRLTNELADISNSRSKPSLRLKKMLRAYVRFSQDENLVFRNAFLFVRAQGQVPPPQVALEKDRFFQTFRGVIEEGQEASMFRSGNPNLLTQMVFGSVHGALALPVNLHRLALEDPVKAAHAVIDAQLEWLQVS